jgi:hypothetical protein
VIDILNEEQDFLVFKNFIATPTITTKLIAAHAVNTWTTSPKHPQNMPANTSAGMPDLTA